MYIIGNQFYVCPAVKNAERCIKYVERKMEIKGDIGKVYDEVFQVWKNKRIKSCKDNKIFKVFPVGVR